MQLLAPTHTQAVDGRHLARVVALRVLGTAWALGLAAMARADEPVTPQPGPWVPDSSQAKSGGPVGVPSGTDSDGPAGVGRDVHPPHDSARVLAPRLKTHVEIEVPRGLKPVEGRVVLRLRVSELGEVSEAVVHQGLSRDIDAAALTAARRLRFEPAQRGGQAVPALILFSYDLPARPAADGPQEGPRSETAGPAPTTAGPRPQTVGAQSAVAVPRSSDGPAKAAAQAELAGREVAESAGPKADGNQPGKGAAASLLWVVKRESGADRVRNSEQAVTVVETDAAQLQTADTASVVGRQEGMAVRRGGGLGSSARVSVNGLSDQQVRSFVDGIPLPLAGFPFGLATVPLAMVHRIDIYRGVVPPFLGADALGGAINLVTVPDGRPGDGLIGSLHVGAFGTYRLSAHGRKVWPGQRWFGELSGFFDRAQNNYVISAEVADSRGRPATTLVTKRNADYGAQGLVAKVGTFGRTWARRLSIRAHLTDFNRGVPHSRLGHVPYGRVRRSAGSIGLEVRHQYNDGAFKMNTRAGLTRRRLRFVDRSRCTHDWYGRCVAETQPGEVGQRAVDRRVGQTAVFARVHAALDLSGGRTLRLSVAPTRVVRDGLDTELRSVGQADSLRGQRNLTSVVAGMRLAQSLLSGDLKGSVFTKYYGAFAVADELQGAAGFVRRDSDMHRAGAGAALRWQVTEVVALKASYEWATRLPSPDEVFGDGALVESNVGLSPENSHNGNLGLIAQGASDRFGLGRLELGLFARRVGDMVLLIVGPVSGRFENVQQASVLGAQASMRWTLPGRWLQLGGAITYQDMRNVSRDGVFARTRGDRLPNRPFLFASSFLRLQWSDAVVVGDVLSAELRQRFVHAFPYGWSGDALAAVERRNVPEQQTWAAAFGYRTTVSGRRIAASVEIQNITDSKVFDLIGVQLPGRAAYAKLTVSL